MATNYTSDMLKALDEAIALGALTVKYADKEVTYRSLTEMLRVQSLMRSELGLSLSGSSRVCNPYYDSGL